MGAFKVHRGRPVSTAIPLVGPHANWIAAGGTAGSGASNPTDPTRTTAKPMASWWTPTLQRFTDDFIVGVIADAKGGILSVAFAGDCATTLVTTPSIRTYSDANGVVKQTPLGYWISLDHSAFVAVNGTTSKVNVYATVTANDGFMQTRVIGGTNVDGDGVSGDIIASAVPQQHYPRATQYTWQATVDLAGAGRVGPDGRYTSYDAAFTALQAATTAQKRAWRITFVGSGVYPSDGFSLEQQVSESEGYGVIDADSGVTARITRGASFDPTNAIPSYWKRSWYFVPGANQIKFTGAGVVFDTKHFRTLIQGNAYQPFWFDGCGYTNSIGTLDTTYFVGADHPGVKIFKGESYEIPCYMTDAAVSYVQPPWCFALTNITGRDPGAGVHNNTRLQAGNYERGATYKYQYTPDRSDRLKVTYAGSATSAIFRVYGYYTDVVDGGLRVELDLDGVVTTIPIANVKESRAYVAGNKTLVSELVTAINANPGWTATMLGDDTGWASWALHGGFNLFQQCKNVDRFWKAGLDKHTEYLQQYGGGAGDENFIIWNNVIRDADYATSFFNDDTAQDVSIRFNVFDEGAVGGGDSSQWGLGKHLLIENNLVHDAIKASHAAGCDAYSSFRQNIFILGPTKNSAGIWPATPGYQDNLWVPSGDGQPNGALDGFPTGNITLANTAAIYAAFTDRTNGDYRPASGGVLTQNKRSRLGTYDGRGNALASSDSIGPWADGYSAPSHPF